MIAVNNLDNLSFVPLHVDFPSPAYPGLHAQVKDSTVSVQVANAWQS